MLVSPRRGSLNTLPGCVSGCVSTPLQGLEVLCRREMHLSWCNFVSIPCVAHSFQGKIRIHSPISCAVENRPQEIVFSQLTPPIGNAKVSSTCAAVPFGEVRSHSRVPACRNRAAKQSGRTSQPLAMLCATRSDLRAARGPLQPIGCRLFRSAGVNDRQSRFSRIESVVGAAAEQGYSKNRDDVSRSHWTPVDATISTPQQTQRRRLSGTPRSGDLERNERASSIPGFAVIRVCVRLFVAVRGRVV